MGNAKTITWPISFKVKDRRFLNIEHIHPINQLAVLQFLDNIKGCDDITKVVVFGSSVRNDCYPWSDLDVYVEGAVRGKTIFSHSTDAPSIDVIYGSDFSDSEDRTLLDEINETGVVVYVR